MVTSSIGKTFILSAGIVVLAKRVPHTFPVGTGIRQGTKIAVIAWAGNRLIQTSGDGITRRSGAGISVVTRGGVALANPAHTGITHRTDVPIITRICRLLMNTTAAGWLTGVGGADISIITVIESPR